MELTRRRLLHLAGGSLAAQACGTLPFGQRPVTLADGVDALAKRMVWGGQGPDAIPPIEGAQYERIADATSKFDDESVVDGLVFSRGDTSVAVAYPRLITVWHEIVNEEVGGEPVAITYCPLTGSTVVFSGRLPDGRPTTFGTSGNLLNSNLVMRDRTSGTLWSQLLGVGLDGALEGERLRELPVGVTTTLGRWRQRYPETRVLTVQAGIGQRLRPYGTSPYGDYDTSPRIIFPVEARDDRFHPKKVVVGLRLGEAALAIPKQELLAKDELVEVEIAGEPLLVVPDAELGVLRVFRRRFPRFTLRFARRGAAIVDDQTGTSWDREGCAVEGELRGARLAAVNAFDVQWFAWYAFYPKTAVLD